jgi:troponin T
VSDLPPQGLGGTGDGSSPPGNTGNDKPSVGNTDPKAFAGRESIYKFDSSALERAAQAAKELERSQYATQAFDVVKMQEQTKQLEIQKQMKEYAQHEEEIRFKHQQQLNEEKRKMMNEESQHQAERAKFQDQLARKRMQDQAAEQSRLQDEERRRQEDEARKEKAEADRQKKEEEKRKRQQLMAGLQASGGPNFEIMKKDKQAEKFDKFGNIVKAKAEMGLTKEQQDEQKKRALADLVKPIDTAGLDVAGLRTKIKDLHARITRLEGQKYDMEKRRDRQEYDLKELNERQRQISRNKAMKKGLNPDEVANSPHPPKVPVASKYDRQIDRRSYHDRFTLFEAPPKPKKPAIHHGSARPPSEWGRKESEELENLRKNLEPPKYQEAVKIEGARAPMEPIPVSIEGDENPDEEEE